MRTPLPRKLFKPLILTCCLLVLSTALVTESSSAAPPDNPRPHATFDSGDSVVDIGVQEGEADIAAVSQSSQVPDATLEVPWNGVLWQSMPNFTWAACGIGPTTRKAIDIAIGQWAYAAANQGTPIRLTETACDDGVTDAQIRLYAANPEALGAGSRDYFGLTLTRDASDKVCGLGISQPCEAQVSRVYLFTAVWARNQLSPEQEAKTIAHEIGHAIGLAHARFCNFDSLMAQNCEPIFQGLGPADVESVNSLADYVRGHFGKPAIGARPTAMPASGRGGTVTYKAGYNLVAGPRGTNFAKASGPLYAFLPGDSAYRAIPASQGSYGSWGYWAYFSADVTVQLNGTGEPFFSGDAPPGQWILVGNSSGTSQMQIIGVDAMYSFDPQSGQYVSTTSLQPGQAAWVHATARGYITAFTTTLSEDQITCYRNLGTPSSCGGS